MKPYTFKKLLADLQQLDEKALSRPVVLYNVNNDETTTIEELSVKGTEDEEDCIPRDEHVKKGRPYLVQYE